MTSHPFIGKGWRFPVKVTARGQLAWSEGPDRIRDAIWIIVNTAVGERLMLPDFGAGAATYVFQPNSAATRTALTQSVREALQRWEPRIELDSVRVDEVPGEPSQVIASIQYRLRATNELFNMVLPFFLTEGVS